VELGNENARKEEQAGLTTKSSGWIPRMLMPGATKGDALQALGNSTAADAAFAKARELGYTG